MWHEVRADVPEDFDCIDNGAQRHSTLGYLGPVEVENRDKLV
ncbi:hypothetical protein HNR01_005601 [Methylorubrum rhodesianum]|nr:hypothetical protein [Methylorubrum rhodesianum]